MRMLIIYSYLLITDAMVVIGLDRIFNSIPITALGLILFGILTGFYTKAMIIEFIEKYESDIE